MSESVRLSLCVCVCVLLSGRLHAARVVKSLQGPKVPPRWRQPVLQEAPTALTRGLEELNVAPQPRLSEGGEGERDNRSSVS